jgi:multidrug transporter EmrE-like cation transporter
LVLAVAFEVAATSLLKMTDGFNRLYPTIGVVAGYSVAFFFLSLTLKTLPVSFVYAVWCGLGIMGIAFIGVFFYHEEFGPWHLLGTLFIIGGVVTLSLVTKAH